MPILLWTVTGLASLWVVSSNVKTLSDSAKTATDSLSSLFREVIIPGVLIYGAYTYLKSKNKI